MKNSKLKLEFGVRAAACGVCARSGPVGREQRAVAAFARPKFKIQNSEESERSLRRARKFGYELRASSAAPRLRPARPFQGRHSEFKCDVADVDCLQMLSEWCISRRNRSRSDRQPAAAPGRRAASSRPIGPLMQTHPLGCGLALNWAGPSGPCGPQPPAAEARSSYPNLRALRRPRPDW